MQSKEKAGHMAKKTISFEEREANILAGYFSLNKRKKSRTINLYFDSADELLENSHQKKENRFFSPEVREEIQKDIAKRPSSYKADIVLCVKDYQGREPETLNKKRNDSFSMMGYAHQSGKKNTWFAATRLVLVGLATLYLRYFLQREGYLAKDSTNVEIIKEFRDITAWVFIWEAVSILLVTPSEDTIFKVGAIRKINSISFADGEGNIKLVYSSGKAKRKYSPYASFRKGARIGLLVAGGGLWGMGFTRCLSRIDFLIHPERVEQIGLLSSFPKSLALAILVTCSSLFVLSCFFAGVGAFNLYNSSHHFRAFSLIGGTLIALVFGFGLYVGFKEKEWKLIIQCGFTFFFLLVSVISSLLQRQKRTNIRDTALVVKLETAESKRQEGLSKKVSAIQKAQREKEKQNKE